MRKHRTFHSVALGESHKVKKIPCQDAALSFEDAEKGFYIAAISDGHGSERHFMSEHGSKILVEVAIEQIKSFVELSECNLLAVPFSMSEVISDKENIQSDNKKLTNQDRLLKGLISSVISNWNVAIEKHWMENKPSVDSMKDRNVPQESIDDYLNDLNLEFAYGCTLIAFTKTPDFWFAFQIGDGTCIGFNHNAQAYHPIPNDERFSGSTTASMCNEDAIDSFRYCYGNNNVPVAIFLGSDGLDGAFGTVDEFSLPLLENFYTKIIKSFASKGYESTVEEIEKTLPALSEKGVTRDDMSLAGMVNLDEIKALLPILIENELEFAKKELAITEKHLSSSKTNLDLSEKDFNQIKDDLKRKEEDLKRAEEDAKNERKRFESAERDKQKADKRFANIKSDFEKLNEELKRIEEELRKAELSLTKSAKEKEGFQKKLEALLDEKKNLTSPDDAKGIDGDMDRKSEDANIQ